ncbi:uncharacterized protein LOC118436581 [Folsomia candida]|uniref:Lopap n=1 Tax=Folsomia candida TaxID=158441 RepID=A0A226E0S7_FOLCA|nr:uncharacterized protein LOC118436581 [Folsomia candida]OXA50076.1 Lopap [Folsomia candida]
METLNTSVFLILCIFRGTTISQMPHTGDCPPRTALHTIDARKLSGGVWYENQRTASLVEWPYKCITFKIQPFYEHKSTLTVTSIHRLDGGLVKYSVSLKSLDPEGRNGKMTAKVPLVEGKISRIYTGRQMPIQILAMDNSTTSWAIVWSCRAFPRTRLHTESVWVLTRERELDETVSREIQESLTALNLEHLVMRDSMQNECSLEDEIK